MISSNMEYLQIAGAYARNYSGCTKVSVGSCIVKNGVIIALGANRACPNTCKTQGCLRVEKYGNNSKEHRNPDDCRAIHSEADAIARAARDGISTAGATLYVTRYPCEACARLIVMAGIKLVVYGRQQSISAMTKQIFEEAGVICINYPDYMEDDTVV